MQLARRTTFPRESTKIRACYKPVAMAEQDEVLTSTCGRLMTVVLNRPKALNSLNMNMVRRLQDVLKFCAKPDSGVGCVLVKGAGGKAFCAGGDVKDAVLQAREGRYSEPEAFFDGEYDINLRIARLPVPYVALIDGIVMGGGAGVSIHGHYRVATERTLFAMPECAIGLFPDIGASFFLQRLPGCLGRYLALTGSRLSGVTVKEAGLATHYVPSSALPQLEQQLQQLYQQQPAAGSGADEVARVGALLDAFQASCGPLPKGDLSWLLPAVDRHFHHESVEAILASLQHEHYEQVELQGQGQQGQQQSDEARRVAKFVSETLLTLNRLSPLALKVTEELLRVTRGAPLERCLAIDSVLVRSHVRGGADFYEGVRAMLIDKSRPPVWQYAEVGEIPRDHVTALFSPQQASAGRAKL